MHIYILLSIHDYRVQTLWNVPRHFGTGAKCLDRSQRVGHVPPDMINFAIQIRQRLKLQDIC